MCVPDVWDGEYHSSPLALSLSIPKMSIVSGANCHLYNARMTIHTHIVKFNSNQSIAAFCLLVHC